MNFSTDIENEVDAIRDKLYNEIKDMSVSERSAYINSGAEAVIKQFDLRLVKSAVRSAADTVRT
jgi:glutamine synthetase type III